MGKRLIILSALVLFLASASAQQDTLKYRISLRDKALPFIHWSILNSSFRRKPLQDVKNRTWRLIPPTCRFAVSILMKYADKE